MNEQFLRGRLNDIPDNKSNSVRIFVSSTFTDTVDERDTLILSIYPKLREYCQQTYKIQFQYTDMRWGVQDEASNDHSTVDICLDELQQCYRLSLATNCAILLSHRYGARMLPARIEEHVFRALENVLSDEDKVLVNREYRLDKNFVDSVYVLQPIDPKSKKEWWDVTNKKLQTALRNAADVCYLQKKTITENEKDEFHISVTAKEIYQALKNNQNRPNRTVVFLREIEDINDFDSKLKSKFNDTAEDKIEPLLAELKEYIKSELDLNNIFIYKVKWTDEASKTQYLAQFTNDFYNSIKNQIDYHMAKIQTKNILNDEVLEHAIQCKSLNERYFPRDTIVDQIKNILLADDNRPCIIYGVSGTGKSSVMAELAIKAPSWFSKPNFVSIILRFLGTTSLSTDIRHSLISMIQQISKIFNIDVSSLDPSRSVEDIHNQFKEILTEIPAHETVILLFDSIDQLQTEYYDCSKWLPVNYPKNVKCILSTIPTISDTTKDPPTTYEILNRLKAHLADPPSVEITQFDEDSARKVFQSWLERDRRCLTPIQMEWLQEKFEPHTVYTGFCTMDLEPTPLFLSLIYDMTLKWHSYDENASENFTNIESTTHAIEDLYAELSKKHNPIFFKRAIGYLKQAGGLAENELEDLLAADNEVLQAIFVHYLPPVNIFRVPSTLWVRIRNDMKRYLVERMVDDTSVIYFYHRSFQEHEILDNREKKAVEAVRRAYFAGNVFGLPDLHKRPFEIKSRKLIERNNGISSINVDRRLTPQLPYVIQDKVRGSQTYNMRRINQLCRNMFNYMDEPLFAYDYDFMFNYFQHYKLNEKFSPKSSFPRFRFLHMQYQSVCHIFEKYPNNFAFEISTLLIGFADSLPDILFHLLCQCQQNCALNMIKNQMELSDWYLLRNSIGTIRDISQGEYCLFLLLPEKLLVIGTTVADWIGQFREHRLPSHDYKSIASNPEYCGVYSKESIRIYECLHHHKFMIQLNYENIIDVQFIFNSALLIISENSKSIDFRNVLKPTSIGRYEFDTYILQCKSIAYKSNMLIKVSLDNNSIHYIVVKPKYDNEHYVIELSFTPLTILKEKIADENIFLNDQVDFYYTREQSNMTLFHFHRLDNERFEQIKNLPPISRFGFRTQFFFKKMHTALVWISNGSIVVFHSCENYFIIPGNYHRVSSPYNLTTRQECSNIITCVDQTTSIIDIIEWKCDESKHSYRSLGKLQLNYMVSHYSCCINDETGINIYCILDNGELRQYNLTILKSLLAQPTNAVEVLSMKDMIDVFQIQNSYVITLNKQKRILKLFTLNNHLACIMKLCVSYPILKFTTISSHILLFDNANTLSIYSISEKPELLLQTNDFQHESINIYSFGFSFIIVDSQKRKIFKIETRRTLNLECIVRIKIKFDINLCFALPERSDLLILSKNYSSIAIWDSTSEQIRYESLAFKLNNQIKALYGLSHGIIFHDSRNQIYLKYNNTENELVDLGHADIFEMKSNMLILYDRMRKLIIIYDVQEKYWGTIRSKINFDALCLTNDGKYLFGIAHQQSLLVMYSVNNGDCIEKIFIENLSLSIQATNDRLLLNRNGEILLISIHDKDKRISDRNHVNSLKVCPLFENNDWINCHRTGDWISSIK